MNTETSFPTLNKINFCQNLLDEKGRTMNTETSFRALVARNFYWALLSKKGTVK